MFRADLSAKPGRSATEMSRLAATAYRSYPIHDSSAPCPSSTTVQPASRAPRMTSNCMTCEESASGCWMTLVVSAHLSAVTTRVTGIGCHQCPRTWPQSRRNATHRCPDHPSGRECAQ